MFRYVALIWNSRITAHTASAQRLATQLLRSTSASGSASTWQSAWWAPGLQLLYSGAVLDIWEVHILPQQRGLLLGTVFARHTDPAHPPRAPVWDDTTLHRLISSNGRSMVHDCWGSYVLLLHDAQLGACSVLKDPCGELPCHQTANDGVELVFSDVRDLRTLGIRPQVNGEFLRNHLVSGGLNQLHPPLTGVRSIGRGECVTLRPGGNGMASTYQQYWQPLEFAHTRDPIERADAAAHELRDSVMRCTRAWTSRHPCSLMRLSGGLDSSIVLGCLASSLPAQNITAFTHWDESGRADERPWARLAASRAQCAHREYAVDPRAAKLDQLPALADSLQPASVMAYLFRAPIEQQLTRETGASAIFTGNGGDSGFCSDCSALSLVEYLHRHRLGPRTLRIASQVALSCELSTWQVLRRSLRRWRHGARMRDELDNMMSGARMVHSEVIAATPMPLRYPHPWFAESSDIPWACARRLGALLYPPDFYDPSLAAHEAAPHVVSPLYSQPVIEVMLRIPLYTHFEGGVDRGLARRAFAQELPTAIAQRQWKDRAPGFLPAVVHGNRRYLRDMLLNGVLVRDKLLDGNAIEAALTESPTKIDVYPGEILGHLELECWARHWSRA